MKTLKLGEHDEKFIEFSSVKEKDTLDVYGEFITVKEAKETQLIPSGWHSLFEDKCECGSDNIISKNLKTLRCCNPRCFIKEGHMLSAMIGRFGIKNWGPATCIDIMGYLIRNDISKSHIKFFDLADDLQNRLFTANRKLEYNTLLDTVFSQKYTASELVSKLGLPNLDKSSEVIFGDYDSTASVYKAIKSKGVKTFLAEKNVHDVATISCIKEFLGDIIYAEYLFRDCIRLRGNLKIDLVITGVLYPYGKKTTKQKFIEMLNETATTPSGIKLYEFSMTDKKQSAPYVIADYVSNTEKYRAGKARGVLCTSTDLLEKVKEVVDNVERR